MPQLAVVNKPVAEPSPLSPARAQLAGRRGAIQEAEALLHSTRAVFTTLQAEASRAQADATAAQRAVDAISEAEANELRAWAVNRQHEPRPAPLATARAKAIATLERANDAVESATRAVASAQAEMTTAATARSELIAGLNPLVLGVLVEEHNAAMTALADARTALAKAELHVLSLHDHIGAQARSADATASDASLPWLRALEALRKTAGEVKLPAVAGLDRQSSAARWAALARRLATDPSAQLE